MKRQAGMTTERHGQKAALLALGVMAMFLLGIAAAPASAESKKLLGTFQAWDAFTLTQDNGRTICYMVSLPEDTSPDNVNRGETYITVTHSPARKAYDEVNVVAGYPYDESEPVTFNIDGNTFDLFTKGDAAWAYDSDQDREIVNAMKQGLNLIVTGLSTRGTTTRDEYSLLGFTDAHAAISKACNR